MGNEHNEFPGFEEVGCVDVDSGTIWVGDPCYVIRDQDESRPEDLGKDWEDVCERFEKRGGPTSVANFGHVNSGTVEPGFGLGVMIGTQFGDGTYPVFVQYDDDGRPKRVLIDFDPFYED